MMKAITTIPAASFRLRMSGIRDTHSMAAAEIVIATTLPITSSQLSGQRSTKILCQDGAAETSTINTAPTISQPHSANRQFHRRSW